MSAAISAGYVNRPADTKSCWPDLSLNWVMRDSSPNDAVHSSSQLSWACSGTWLCTNSVQMSGSRPDAMRIMATSSVLRCSSAGSWGIVRAWRSTTQKMASSWSSAQLRIAPRKFPRWMSPVGWMPEKTRAMGRHGMPGFPPPHRYCGLVAYEVTTAVFEGPFDLLLHLITREQVDIYEVSLSAIVDAYIQEL